MLTIIHPAIIEKIKREREERERRDAEDRRIPLYVPLPEYRREPEPKREIEYEIEF